MDEHRQRSRLRGGQETRGTTVTAGPAPLTTPQCCTHRPGVNCVQANACPCRAANRTYTSGCPLENFRNQGPTRAPTAPRLTANASKIIEEAQEAAPTLYHTIPPLVFHQDAPTFSPSVLPGGDEWPALPACADTAHAYPALTETTTPNPAALEAVGSGKRNSNRARPTDGQTVSPSIPADQDIDFTSVESIGERDGDSDYVKSAENSSTSPANTLDLEGHINELEEMHEVVESELVKLTRLTVIFFCIDELELPELDDAETNPPENHQDNDATPPVNNQPSPPNSPL